MAADTLKSFSITNLDTVPVAPNTTGEPGGKGYMVTVDDMVTVSATGIGTLASTYRLIRFPTNAKIKSLVIATNKALDSHSSSTLAFDLNVVFSDSTIDGTSTALQGMMPTTANTGSVLSVAAAYTATTENKLFGTVTPTSNTAAYGPTDVILNGMGTVYPLIGSTTNVWGTLAANPETAYGIVNSPLWALFGFTVDPGGMFDLLAYVSTAATTGVAGQLWARMTYVV
jgi:hypothetical protein